MIAFVLSSCVSHENKMLKKYGEQPEWAAKTPSSHSYFSGIGIVKKNITEYRKVATKIALDNLINEISVNVSSSSLFSTLETNDSFNEEFSQNIHLSSKETIEGYELVDTWENEHQYFAYYQLSKTKHKQLKAKRIKLAVDRAKKTFLTAIEMKKSGNYKQAIVSDIQALEILNPFLDQDLGTEINGKQVNMAVEIVHAIKSIEDEIMMTPSFYEKTIKMGKTIDARDLYVTVTNKKGEKLSNIPVLFTHKAISSKKLRTNSDDKGVAAFNLGKIKSSKGHQEILVNFDFNTIVKEATQNRLIRKIINYQEASKVQMTLHVEVPAVFVKGKESLNGEPSKMQLNIKSKIQRSLLDNKFDIANTESEADLVLEFDIRSNSMTKANPLNVVSSNGNITIFEKTKLIHSQEISLQKGAHITLNEAMNEAYKKVSNHINSRIIPQFSSHYFKY